MAKIYKLSNDTSGDYSHFIFYEGEGSGVTSFRDDTFLMSNSQVESKTYHLFMDKSDMGKLNFKTDFSLSEECLILSEKAFNVLEPFLTGAGKEIKAEHNSKRKKIVVFFPDSCKAPLDIVDFDWSDWKLIEGDKDGKCYDYFMFRNIFLNKNSLSIGRDLFILEKTNMSPIFVTDEFKRIVEKNELKGFSFEYVVFDSEQDQNWRFELIKSKLDCPQYGKIIRDAFNFYENKEMFDEIDYKKKSIEEYPFEMEYQNRLKEGTINMIRSIKDAYNEKPHRLMDYYCFLGAHNIKIKDKYSYLLI